MADWINGMREIAMNAYQNSQPSDVCFGVVISGAPLSVNIEELKLTLGECQMVLPDYLTDRTISVMVGDTAGTAVIPGALQAGDRVILLRKAGGQRYVILGREG